MELIPFYNPTVHANLTRTRELAFIMRWPLTPNEDSTVLRSLTTGTNSTTRALRVFSSCQRRKARKRRDDMKSCLDRLGCFPRSSSGTPRPPTTQNSSTAERWSSCPRENSKTHRHVKNRRCRQRILSFSHQTPSETASSVVTSAAKSTSHDDLNVTRGSALRAVGGP